MPSTYSFREGTYRSGTSLDGFDVEASDGSVGSIDEHSAEPEFGYLVVDTGFWIFGKKRLIPAGVVQRIDYDDEKVHVSMTKDQIKDAPDYDEARRTDDSDWLLESNHSTYYEGYT